MLEDSAPDVSKWLTCIAPATLPADVVAFNFNLAECGDWIVELIGASRYDMDDEDWSCPPEAWTSRPSPLFIPRSVGGATWEQAQTYVAREVVRYLASSSTPQAETLRSAQAVCIGFVDGNLEKLWPEDEA
jgi:hypothetical protein